MKIKKALKIKKFRNPWEKVRINWFYTNNWLSNEVRSIFRDTDITPQQFNVLKIIANADEPHNISSSYIKKRLVERDADISRLINRLEEIGLIRKASSTIDKRKMEITLTDLGTEMVNDFSKKEKAMDRLFKVLSREEVRQLNGLIEKIRIGVQPKTSKTTKSVREKNSAEQSVHGVI